MSRRELHPLVVVGCVAAQRPHSPGPLRPCGPPPHKWGGVFKNAWWPEGLGRPPGLGGFELSADLRPSPHIPLPEGERVAAATFQSLSATRRRADRARGFAATSASEGRTGCRVMTRRVARWPQVQTGCWGGQMQSLDSTLKNDLTKRSSREWKLIVAIRPPGLSVER